MFLVCLIMKLKLISLTPVKLMTLPRSYLRDLPEKKIEQIAKFFKSSLAQEEPDSIPQKVKVNQLKNGFERQDSEGRVGSSYRVKREVRQCRFAAG